ncbi:MAG: redoxin domain-containing protein [Acidobacteria bacterium]|nr:redoxin domain-containing protein [Acidobacteriota bacterium]MCA1608737.1 redoxin domain-containing protein [Acidobacteriota bacterium]
MKILYTLVIFAAVFTTVYSQNESSPLVEKDIAYKDWVYKDIRTGSDRNLRKFVNGKKLVMVAYFAPWCPNWKHDAPLVQKLYDKYKAHGFDVIAVGEYDPVAAMKTHIDAMKLTFPAVYENESRADKDKTAHAEYRKSVGDTRKWGSPWYIFLEAPRLEPEGLALTRKAFTVSGELREAEVEKMIREKLGLSLHRTTDSKIGLKQP